MNIGPTIAFVTPVAIIFAAGIAWCGNYLVQRGTYRHIRLIRNVDDLKRSLHDFVDLSVSYWTLDSPRSEKHRMLEAQIIARMQIIREEFAALKFRSNRLKKSYQQTFNARADLWDEATGGRFQQDEWRAEPDRVIKVTAEVCRIVRSLNKTY